MSYQPSKTTYSTVTDLFLPTTDIRYTKIIAYIITKPGGIIKTPCFDITRTEEYHIFYIKEDIEV